MHIMTTISASSSSHLLHNTNSNSTSNHPHSPRSTTSSCSNNNNNHCNNSSGSGSTNQACAACKYQRRKCNPDCPLAPYFPADQQRRFLNAHRLFGVSNILKTLRRLDPSLCADAMRSLIFQADARALDPVGGCCRIILDLERQLDLANAELSAVLHHLALCRQAAANASTLLPADPTDQLDATSNPTLLLNAEQQVVDAIVYTNQETEAILQTEHDCDNRRQQQQEFYDYFYYDASAGDGASSKTSSNDGMHHQDNATGTAGKAEVAESLVLGQQLQQHCHIDHKEMKPPLVDVFYMSQAMTSMEGNDNADVGDEQEEAKNTMDTAQMADSSHCRLGLGFSSF